MFFDPRDYTQKDGTLIAYAWPGGYPILYYTVSGDVLCAACALCALASDDDPVKAAEIHYEGPPLECADCGEWTESAYGDPNAPDKEETPC